MAGILTCHPRASRGWLIVILVGMLTASAVLPAAAGARSRPPAHKHHGGRSVHVRLSHHTLTVTGTRRADQIEVQQRRGHPGIARILVDRHRAPLFTVARARLARIRIDGGAGKDTIAVSLPAHVWSRLPVVIAGQAGDDTVAFTGSRARDRLALTAAGRQARLTDGTGGASLTLTGVEHVAVAPLGGADTLNVGNLAHSGVRTVTENLAGTPAGGDQTVLEGTGSGDAVAVAETAGATTVTGLPATVVLLNAGPATGTLQILGLGGDDSFAVAGLGSLPLGIDGGAGTNSASFGVSAAAAHLNLAANGAGAVLTGGAATAMSAIATVHFATSGPGDQLAIGDLAGTSVTAVSQDLAGTPSGSDRTTVSATAGPDAVTIAGGSGSATVTGIPAPVTITHADPAIESLTVDGLGGADTISAATLSGGSPPLTIAGGPGNDTLTGSPQGDRFEWNAGDGNDQVEGGAGADTLAFTGAGSAENVALAPAGTHATLSDDLGPVALDLHAVEQVDVAPGGGNDTLTVGDLTATGVQQVRNDVAEPNGTDQTIVNGTAAPDTISIGGGNGTAAISGLTPTVTVVNADPSRDGVTVSALSGADTITAAAMATAGPALTLDGGDDNDTITGGAGDDLVDGGRGNDVADLGAGDDQFVWDPGDGSDTVEGGVGTDTLDFHGSNVTENMAVSANGARVRFTRDVANITMDLGTVEAIDLSSLAGADVLNVGDMTGTSLRVITDDQASAVGGTAPATGAHSVIVNGTSAADNVTIAGTAGSTTESGLTAAVTVIHADPAIAALTIDGNAGADTISAAATTSGAVPLTINGGDDNDTITGGAGDDVVVGGRGNDLAMLGGGNDQFVWNPGDGSDTVDGGTGNDRLTFNGANVNEKVAIAANGTRVGLTRDVGNITMDLNALEELDLATLGGADNISIGDLSGTGMSRVAVNLGALGGGGDGQADTVTVNGTNGNDAISSGDLGAGGVKVTGVAAEVDVSGADPALDLLALDGGAGDDVIDATAMTTGSMLLHEDGGDGNDVLIGGAGNDTITGDAGDDVLEGGPGVDVLDGGTGNNILIQ